VHATDRSIEDAWRALRARLDARAADAVALVRAYPGPIARCDDQLPQFIAERSVAVRLAADAAALDDDPASSPRRRAGIARFAAMLAPGDDAVLATARADLLARLVLRGLRARSVA
jgi:hypothetical protein